MGSRLPVYATRNVDPEHHGGGTDLSSPEGWGDPDAIARACFAYSVCPACGTSSRRVRGRYSRRLDDLPGERTAGSDLVAGAEVLQSRRRLLRQVERRIRPTPIPAPRVLGVDPSKPSFDLSSG